jgi:glutathione synthase/RimK-type ligase-like ATP-grasp enzyme
VILVWGPADDPPVERIVSILKARAAELVHVHENNLATLNYDVTLGASVTGWFEAGGRTVRIDELTGIYVRPGDLPAGRLPAAALDVVASCAPATVVNRPSAGRSNWSKPFQSRLIAAAGFAVPDTLVTTDPQAARAFLAHHERIVYKSISGIRSIVATLGPGDGDRLDGVATGPVQLQQWIAGRDVRVHVVGEIWFATAIDSRADDYRYGARDGAEPCLAPLEIPAALGERLVTLTKDLGLLVSGIDLRVTPGGNWICFEVNPSPGFTFYEDATDQPIAEAIADLLQAGASGP